MKESSKTTMSFFYQVNVDKVAIDVAVLDQLRNSAHLLRAAAANLDPEYILRSVALDQSPLGCVGLENLKCQIIFTRPFKFFPD